MTVEEMIVAASKDQRVKVTGGDYTYEGNVVASFTKLKGAARCVVEDDNGRLFIHNADNLSEIDVPHRNGLNMRPERPIKPLEQLTTPEDTKDPRMSLTLKDMVLEGELEKPKELPKLSPDPKTQ